MWFTDAAAVIPTFSVQEPLWEHYMRVNSTERHVWISRLWRVNYLAQIAPRTALNVCHRRKELKRREAGESEKVR